MFLSRAQRPLPAFAGFQEVSSNANNYDYHDGVADDEDENDHKHHVMMVVMLLKQKMMKNLCCILHGLGTGCGAVITVYLRLRACCSGSRQGFLGLGTGGFRLSLSDKAGKAPHKSAPRDDINGEMLQILPRNSNKITTTNPEAPQQARTSPCRAPSNKMHPRPTIEGLGFRSRLLPAAYCLTELSPRGAGR